jgi:hypothetical protein
MSCIVTMSDLQDPYYNLVTADLIQARVRVENKWGKSKWSSPNTYPVKVFGVPSRVA